MNKEEWQKESKERGAGSRNNENTALNRSSVNERRVMYVKRHRRRN